MRTMVIAFVAALLAGTAYADEQVIKLKQAPGLDKVEGNCAAPPLGYIVMNSVYLNSAGWDAEVNKMIKAFGAAIDDADAKAIADYLKKETRAPERIPPPDRCRSLRRTGSVVDQRPGLGARGAIVPRSTDQRKAQQRRRPARLSTAVAFEREGRPGRPPRFDCRRYRRLSLLFEL